MPPFIQRYFCMFYDYMGKVDLSKGYWNPKRKLGFSLENKNARYDFVFLKLNFFWSY